LRTELASPKIPKTGGLIGADGLAYDYAIALTDPIAHLPGLSKFVGLPIARKPSALPADARGVVLAWGRKPSGVRAERKALGYGLPVWRLEDGFLRSVELNRIDASLSLIVDDLGIYYDANHLSRLEKLALRPFSVSELARARAIIAAWREARVSKFNSARDFEGGLPGRYVLAIDQTHGDVSIRCGRADTVSFHRMLDAALAENPDCTVVLKVHPEVLAGRKHGHFDLLKLAENPRVVILGGDPHPASLIERAEAVYVVTSQVGFEGLLWGKPVHVFGMPFYAGWGLTTDALPGPSRRHPISVEALAHATLAEYCHYVDPETGERCEVERVIEWMGFQRRMRSRWPATVHALGFSPWKEPIVRSTFAGSKVIFAKRASEVPRKATLAVWGRKHAPEDLPKVAHLLHLEDGFLRSVGLGADLVHPLSWVVDGRGIYYDATEASDLEEILEHSPFPPALIERAERLRHRIVEEGVTKYNVGSSTWRRPAGAETVILVPGQVESDASIRFGAPGLRANLDLLRAVREANPSAYIIYKPHPDVVAGLRKAGQGEQLASESCNEIVVDVSMDNLLAKADELHVLTSLAGFEALLREKPVTCYGQPFYAGWGLTRDIIPPARRSRHLTLGELVAGALILYPTYFSRTTGKYSTPERALDELAEWRSHGPSTMPLWRRILRAILRLRAN